MEIREPYFLTFTTSPFFFVLFVSLWFERIYQKINCFSDEFGIGDEEP